MSGRYCNIIWAAKKAYIRWIGEAVTHKVELYRVFCNVTGAKQYLRLQPYAITYEQFTAHFGLKIEAIYKDLDSISVISNVKMSCITVLSGYTRSISTCDA